MSCGVGHRCSSDPTLLWLWHRLEAAALIRPPSWEPPYAEGAGGQDGKDVRNARNTGVPVVAQQKRIRLRVRSLASLSGLRIQCYRELWCRSQMQLGSGIAVAVVWAGSCSSKWTPSLGTSICRGSGPRKKEKKRKNTFEEFPLWGSGNESDGYP